MKKFLLVGISIFALQFSTAQNDTDGFRSQKNYYISLGAGFSGDYNINDRLKAAGMPEIGSAYPEFGIGFNTIRKNLLLDMEISAGYTDKKNAENRAKNATLGIALRIHYVPLQTESYFLSGGLDISYRANAFNLYRRDNVIDLNDLNPVTSTGHINLNNEQLYIGPSIAFGFLQNREIPLRLNLGYEIAVTNGKWKSEYADVVNTVKENGHGRFYVKASIYL